MKKLYKEFILKYVILYVLLYKEMELKLIFVLFLKMIEFIFGLSCW